MEKETKKVILFLFLTLAILVFVYFLIKNNFEVTFTTKLISIVLLAFITPLIYGIFRELIGYYNTKYDNKILKKIKSHIDKYFKK